MSRSANAVCKLCRREAAKLFLKGERCYTEKCSFERRPYPPGQFGGGRIRISEFGLQLRGKQKVKRIFLMNENQFRITYAKAVRKKGVKGMNFLRRLEMRLDNICFKAGLSSSLKQARQLISHGHFYVNGKKVSIPSYDCKVGDAVQLKSGSQEMLVVKEAIENAKRRTRPDWISYDESKSIGTVSRVPERDDITHPISERYIVELYSK